MIQFTTYDIQLKVNKKEVLQDLTDIYFTIKQNSNIIVNKKIPLDNVDISEGIMPVSLTQEETSKFGLGPAELQVNFKYDNDIRKASCIKNIIITENLIKEIL